MKPHLVQSYLTICSCGNTPVRRVTTPNTRMSLFRWNCLQHAKSPFCTQNLQPDSEDCSEHADPLYIVQPKCGIAQMTALTA